MTGSDWKTLLEKVPPDFIDAIVLTLSTGMEIHTERILQLQDSHLLIRGRAGGTDEGELVFFSPWDEVKTLHFQRPLPDVIAFKLFGELIGGVKQDLGARAAAERAEKEKQKEEQAQAEPSNRPIQPSQPLPAGMPSNPGVEKLRSKLFANRPGTTGAGPPTNKPGLNKP